MVAAGTGGGGYFLSVCFMLFIVRITTFGKILLRESFVF